MQYPPNQSSTEEELQRLLRAGERAKTEVKTEASQAAEKVRRGAEQAASQAGTMVETAKEKVSEATSQVTDKADEAMNTSGERLEDLAQTMREHAPASGMIGDVAHKAADALETSGRYLQETSPDDVRFDLESLIRSRPVESLAIGFGIGFLLARALRGR